MDSMQQENDPNRMAEKEKNQGVAVAQSKSRPQTDRYLKRAVHEQIPANINEQKKS